MTNTEFLAIRKSLGLTQAALAKLLAVHTSQVVFWETGRRRIRRVAELALLYLEITMPRTRRALSNSEAAAHLKVHRRTLLDWVTAGLIQKSADGSYDSRELDRFLLAEKTRTGRRSLKRADDNA